MINLLSHYDHKSNSVVLYNAATRKWMHYQDPIDIVEVYTVSEVESVLHRIETVVENENLYAAGFVCYEAAPAFDPVLRVHPQTDLPLVRFGLYRKPEEIELGRNNSRDYQLGGWTPSITQKSYIRAVRRIRDLIACGDTYQVNYTFRLRAPFHGNPWNFFLDLADAQRAE